MAAILGIYMIATLGIGLCWTFFQGPLRYEDLAPKGTWLGAYKRVLERLYYLDDLYALAFILFLLAASTDWLDGYLARKWNAVTPLGAALDHAADKVLITCVLVKPCASVYVTVKLSAPLKSAVGVYVHAPVAALMLAVPFAAAPVTANGFTPAPSGSLAVSVPVIAPPSSTPVPLRFPPNTAAPSSTAVTVTLNVFVTASTPPFAVPPLSCTMTVMVAVPFAFATGV